MMKDFPIRRTWTMNDHDKPKATSTLFSITVIDSLRWYASPIASLSQTFINSLFQDLRYILI
jgi:hypothetical protein